MICKKLVLLCLPFVLASALMQHNVSAGPVTIEVPSDFPTIRGAISNANSGDTIHVLAGTYHETVSIDKNLTLVGERGATILDGDGGGPVIQVNLTGVRISGLTIINGHDGIVLERCNGSIIKENSIECSGIGIWLHYSYNDVVSDNYVSGAWSGIVLCGGSSSNIVVSNTFKGNVEGLVLTGMDNFICHNNFMSNQNQTQMIVSFSNAWNNSHEGNYWSDYFGTNFNAYGIGNTPYVIDINNQDDHPLMSPYMVGDANHDAKVNIVDIFIVARAFETQPGDSKWTPYADIDENNVINILDIFKVAKNFRMEWH